MGVCRDGVEHHSVHCTWLCAECLQVNVSVVCVCVHMAVCKAGAVLVSSCTWLCKRMGCTHVCVCMNTAVCIKVFAQGLLVMHFCLPMDGVRT